MKAHRHIKGIALKDSREGDEMTSTDDLVGGVHKRFLISEDLPETGSKGSVPAYIYSQLQRLLLEPVTFIILVWTMMFALVYACFLFTE